MYDFVRIEKLGQYFTSVLLKFHRYCLQHEIHKAGYNSLRPSAVPLTYEGHQQQLRQNDDLKAEISHCQEELSKLLEILEADRRVIEDKAALLS